MMADVSTGVVEPLGACLTALLNKLDAQMVLVPANDPTTSALLPALEELGLSVQRLANQPETEEAGDDSRIVFCAPPHQHIFDEGEKNVLLASCDTLGIMPPGQTVWAYAAVALSRAGTHGRAVLLMPNSSLSRAAWRMGQRGFVDQRLIEAVISLPHPISVTLGVMTDGRIERSSVVSYDAIVVLGHNSEGIVFAGDAAKLAGSDNLPPRTPYERVIESGYLLNPSWYQPAPATIPNGVKLGSVARVTRGVAKSRLRTIAPLSRSSLGTIEEPRDGTDPVAYLTSRDFSHGLDYCEANPAHALPSATYYACSDIASAGATRSVEACVLLSRTGQPFKTCRISPSAFEFQVSAYIVADNLYKIEPSPELDPDYLLAYLSSATGQDALALLANSSVTTHQISPNDLREMTLPLPPLEEQQELARCFLASQEQLLELSQRQSEILSQRDTLIEEVATRA